ncbi:MAG: DUF3137 domain-containing protein [Alphaproteobacteria bacterium]|nr:DUF3137 domain-containing protein [Alphaproteobacteria bacterium]
MASDPETELRKTIETIELERRWRFDTQQERLRASIGITLLVAVIAGIAELLLTPEQMRGLLLWQAGLPLPPIFPTGLLALAVFLALWVAEPAHSYRKYLTQRKFPKIVRLFGEFEYRRRGYVNPDIGGETRAPIVPPHTRSLGADLFTGQRGGARIEFSKLRLVEKDKNGEAGRFQGICLAVRFSGYSFNGLAVTERAKAPRPDPQYPDLKRTKLPDPRFESTFAAWSDKPEEASALLDPIMLESLSRLFDDFSATRLAACLRSGELLVLIETGNELFTPPPLRTPVFNRRPFARLKRDIEAIYSIADTLNRHGATYMREEFL